MFELRLINSTDVVIVDEDVFNYFKDKPLLRLDSQKQKYVLIPDQYYRSLHRFVIKAHKGQEVDHINRNTLDCRKENLRFVTKSTQSRNRKFKTSSGFRGVTKSGNFAKPWKASLKLNGQKIHLGVFATKEEAYQAWQKGMEDWCPDALPKALESTT